MQRVGPANGSFKSITQKAIKQGLSNVLGSSGAVSVMVNFNLEAHEDDPIAFHNTLSSVFKAQAEILEKSIVKELYALMGERFQSSPVFDFSNQMNFAKQLHRAKLVVS